MHRTTYRHHKSCVNSLSINHLIDTLYHFTSQLRLKRRPKSRLKWRLKDHCKVKIRDKVVAVYVLRSDDVLSDHRTYSGTDSIPSWSGTLTHPRQALVVPIGDHSMAQMLDSSSRITCSIAVCDVTSDFCFCCVIDKILVVKCFAIYFLLFYIIISNRSLVKCIWYIPLTKSQIAIVFEEHFISLMIVFCIFHSD